MLLPDSHCHVSYEYFGDEHICSKTESQAICEGDSGSPVYCREGPMWRLTGLVSFDLRLSHDEPCRPGQVEFYVNLPHLHDWIAAGTKK